MEEKDDGPYVIMTNESDAAREDMAILFRYMAREIEAGAEVISGGILSTTDSDGCIKIVSDIVLRKVLDEVE